MADLSREGPEWREIPATAETPAYSLFCKVVQKPDLDNRDYRIIRLENGLVVILVHDEQADKAAASLSVAVGHMQDPDDVPGLAHFCEHMITKGSQPYPAENDFRAFITSNGGVHNAGTAPAYQDYWFSVNPSQLRNALPRLAACFHSPLFTSSLTSREMHAVDSENKRNLQNDVRRIHQLSKSLSISGHPWTKFGTGNLASLTEAAKNKLEQSGLSPEVEDGDGGPIGREVRNRLVEWWKEQYCASRMSLCVLGNESLDELTSLVVPLFTRIPNRRLDRRPAFRDPVWGPEQKGSIVFVKTVKDYHAFSLTFQIPDQAPLYRRRPASYIAHFLGHEGPGSVCAYLKKRGWLLDISASSRARNRSVTSLTVEGKLTREGYLHYEKAILSVFNYIALLQSSVLESYHFDEMKKLAETFFRFREKSQPHSFAREISLDLLEPFELEEILSNGALAREWDEQGVLQILGSMKAENARILLMANAHDSSIISDDAQWESEKWYGTEYLVKRLPDAFLHKANSPNTNLDLCLPRPNPYVPEYLSVDRREVTEVAQMPRCLLDTALSTLWHKTDDQFWVPKAQVRINIKTPVAYATPRHAVLSRLLVDLLEDSLADTTYDAQLAGLHYSVSTDSAGLNMNFWGYDEKLPVLMQTVLDQLNNIVFQTDRLQVKAEQLSRSYKNYYLGQPSSLSQDFTSFALNPIIWTPEEKSAELPYVTLDDLHWHKREIIRKVHLDVLINGNISEKKALDIVRTLESRLSSRSLPPSEWPRRRSLILPSGTNHVLEKTHANPKEKNSALTYYCQFGDIADRQLRAGLRLLVHILKEPVFTQLRTVEQLGYIIAMTIWTQTGSMGLSIKIQSLKSPKLLTQRVDSFLKSHREALVSMDQESFAAKKEALVTRLTEKPKNIAEETSRFWDEIHSGYLDFLRPVTDAQLVNALTLTTLVHIYDRYLEPSSDARKTLLLHLVSQELQDEVSSDPGSYVVITDEAVFKAGLLFSSAAISVS